MATPKLTLITTNQQIQIKKYQKLSMGIHLNNGRYVPPGAIVTTQSAADRLSSVRRPKNSKTYRNYHLSNYTHLRLVTTKPEIQPDCLAV